ncbi:MAG: UDP-2,3-diacylglucosamine diphosphatase [Burkholderiaceae bacterium]|nr:UDP-2,3-diacylglucosamine diphosphatase [Burkholderiaceae bacterium]
MEATQTAQPATVALFISDLHLQAAMPRTAAAFFNFLRRQAMHARQLYLLGDIFEYWAGDDDCDDAFNRSVIDALRAVADSGVELFWVAGNRDFLVSSAFAAAAGLRLLDDPHVIDIAGRRIVLTHGDALCTDDTAYMAFRAQVRDPAWQSAFLARPLAERKAIIAGLRQGSRDAQREKAEYIMDVNADAVEALYRATDTILMIHGHTHRPAHHVVARAGVDYERYVLPDWDCETEGTHRGGWLAVNSDGSICRHRADGTVIK